MMEIRMCYGIYRVFRIYDWGRGGWDVGWGGLKENFSEVRLMMEQHKDGSKFVIDELMGIIHDGQPHVL